VGVIGGPLGMLLGGSYGFFVGSLFDLDEEERTETTLGEISKSVQAERAAVLAVVSEPSPEVIDAAMATLGGTVLRPRPNASSTFLAKMARNSMLPRMWSRLPCTNTALNQLTGRGSGLWQAPLTPHGYLSAARGVRTARPTS
jgi:hypothetical protein